jgi:hypothetical protein
MSTEKDYCFCTLSLGERYRIMTKQLANDLAKYAPDTYLVVGTDDPKDFENCPNILAFKHNKTGILHCYNDKLFVIEHGLSQFQSVIVIDSDTRILSNLPEILNIDSPLIACSENLINHVSKYRSKDLELLKKLAVKLDILMEKSYWIGESLFIISRDNGKEKEFIKTWKILANYAQLKGMHSGEGNLMGLAATKVEWKVSKNETWNNLNNITQHLDASSNPKKLTLFDKLKSKFTYHFRLNKARIFALKDFDFYYR